MSAIIMDIYYCDRLTTFVMWMDCGLLTVITP